MKGRLRRLLSSVHLAFGVVALLFAISYAREARYSGPWSWDALSAWFWLALAGIVAGPEIRSRLRSFAARGGRL